MHVGRRARIIACSLVLWFGCQKSKKLELPSAPGLRTVAFAALFSDAGPVELGPVVLSTQLYAGQYSLKSRDDDLVARVFFIEIDELMRQATAACAAIPSRLESRACLDRVKACERGPTSCLAPLLGNAECIDRIPLDDAIAIQAFEQDSGGRFIAADGRRARAGIKLCGPSLAKACPLLLPGYVVTEGGNVRCLAASSQRGCELDVNLSSCGLGIAHGTIGPEGTIVPAVDLTHCSAGSEPTEPGAFAVTCNARRFIARPMEAPFGETECPRRGPPSFNDTFSVNRVELVTLRGRVVDVEWVDFAGWSRSLLFDGTGIDGCSCPENGMPFRNCRGDCSRECEAIVTLPDCVGLNAQHECRAIDDAQRCVDRCIATCDRGLDHGACTRELAGHQLLISPPDDPETNRASVRLDDLDLARRLGSLALVTLGARGGAVAVGLEKSVKLLDASRPNTLAELTPPAEISPGIVISGLAERRGTTELVAYGSLVEDATAGFSVVRVTGTPPYLSASAPVRVDLPSIDAAVLVGDGSRVAAISIAPPLESASSDVSRVIFAPLAGGEAQSIAVEGQPTALGALEGNRVAVGLSRRMAASAVAILEPREDRFVVVANVEILGGLRPTAILDDARGCQAEHCVAFIGLERPTSSQATGLALVARLVYTRNGVPFEARIPRFFAETGSTELSLLVLDPEANRLFALASASNQLSPIKLWP